MEVKDIVEFLRERKGYQKEGARRLALKVLKGRATEEDCLEALQIVRDTVKKVENITIGTTSSNTTHVTLSDTSVFKIPNKPEPELKLRSRWQNANGEWLESYRAVANEETTLTLEDVENSVKKALKEEPVVKIKLNTESTSFKSMLVWTSDKHIGADTTEAQHDKPYNKEVFSNRMKELLYKIHMKSLELKGLDTLVIADLGDATDGQDGYTASRSHKLPQNMTNREVFETYFEVHKAFIDYLVENKIADKYEFWFNTRSNHGGSYEYACAKAFQIYIQTKYPDIKIKSFDNFLGHTEFKGVTYLLTHGKDDTNRKFGLPLYPDAKTEVFIDNYLKLNKLSFNKNIRLIKGDLHQSASVPCKNINKYRNVASMFGSSGWVMDNFGYTAPGTDYEIINNLTGEILEGTFWYN